MNPVELIKELKKSRVVPKLIGDQIRLVGDTANLSNELIQQVRAFKKELGDLLRDSTDEFIFSSDNSVRQQESYPVSDAQKGIWILSQLGEGNAAYNILTGLYLHGVVDLKVLNEAFRLSIQRHESLRTLFKEREGRLTQVVLHDMPFTILSGSIVGTNDLITELESRIDAMSHEETDLQNGPLLKVSLLQFSELEYALLIRIHHIISDGWSIRVLLEEVIQAYRTMLAGAVSSPAPLRIQYKDWVYQMELRAHGVRGERNRDFWRSQFLLPALPLDLPTDFRRPPVRSFEGAVTRSHLDEGSYQRIVDFCKKYRATPFNFFRAVITILLSKFTGQQDITIGTPVSGRNNVDLEDQIGLFVNTLPLRIEVNDEQSFVAFLGAISENSFRAFEFQDYPFDRIISDLSIKRDVSRNPLFDVMLVLQDVRAVEGINTLTGQNGLEIGSLESYLYGSSLRQQKNVYSKYDLTFNLGSNPGSGFFLEIEYAIKLFKEETITRLLDACLYIIKQVLLAPEITVSRVEIVGQNEKTRILQSFNDTAVAHPAERTVTDLFEEQVRRSADAIAVVCDERSFSYRELDEKSGQLADYLRRKYSIQPNDLVGIRLERSEWMIVAILGVLKAGAAYVPVDPEYPQERIEFVLNDSHCKLVLDESEMLTFRRSGTKYNKLDLPMVHRPGDLAYIIYTSGSTGRPKGVMIEHRSTAAFIDWCKDEFRDADCDVVLGVTSICFDLSIFEIFYALTSGKKLSIVKNALLLPEHLKNNKNILLNTVPSVVAALLKEGVDLSAVTVLNMAGEPLPASLPEGLDPDRMEIRNLYGPTEDTTYSSSCRIRKGTIISIGHPVANTKFYIVNKDRQLQPIGVAGEICISGPGLARGYLNRPDLTSAKFVADPFSPGERMYMTGDWGRWLPDGAIEFLGRKDEMVKIRGYRIEPGEIENILRDHPAIVSAIVVPRINRANETELVAYLTGAAEIVIPEIKTYAAKLLPGYMLPAYFIQVPSFPVTPNGKIDKKNLPDPDARPVDPDAGYPAPANATEELLMTIWKEILNREVIDIQDNFFDLGGHSIKVMHLAGRIHKVFNVSVSLNDLFTMPILEDQASLILQAKRTEFRQLVPGPVMHDYPLSAAQRRLWVLSQFEEGNKAYNMPIAYGLEGDLDRSALELAFKQLIKRHEILRTVFKEDEKGEIRQFILDPELSFFSLFFLDLRQEKEQEEKVRSLLDENLTTVYDLSCGPLLRACLLQVAENKWILGYSMHHMIADGWSVEVLIRELALLYNAGVRNEAHVLPPLFVHYKDHAFRQEQELSGGFLPGQKEYWLRQFEGELPVLELPFSRPRPQVRTYNGGRMNRAFPADTGLSLQKYCLQQGGTLFMGFLAAVNVLLHRYTGQQDIVIGAPIAGRDHIDLENQVGLYADTLAVRTRFTGIDNFAELFSIVRNTVVEAYEHPGYPFSELVNALPLQKDMSRNALFDVMIVLQNRGAGVGKYRQGMDNILLGEYAGWNYPVAKFDLTFNLSEEEEGLGLCIEYNSDLYTGSSIEGMADDLLALLKAVLADPGCPIQHLDYIGEIEKQQLLEMFNASSAVFPGQSTVIELFEKQVERTPDHAALLYVDGCMTYRQVNVSANQLADYLENTYRVGKGDLVGINLERNEWLIIAILAVLKSGGAYIPIDPDYPHDRISYMINDSGCKAVVDAAEISNFMTDREKYRRENGKKTGVPDDLFYVIYTSGSSGKPKGAKIKQYSFVNLLSWYGRMLDLNEEDCVLLIAPVSFDLAQKNIFAPLLAGARLCLPAKLYGDYPALADLIQEQGVTIVNAAPSAFYPLLDRSVNADFRKLSSLRKIVLGGEPISIDEIRPWIRSGKCRGQWINSYGPTECTDVVAAYALTGDDLDGAGPVPIGKPVDNCRIYILDGNRALVPIGITGEIYIAGVCIGDGYLGRADLTNQQFIPDPFRNGEIMYRTGDLGRWLSNGNIDFAGRRDDQVKIMGYRVELGEIESAVRTFPGVRSAVVLARADVYGRKELVAYITGNLVANTGLIRSHLVRTLSGHMIPSHFIVVDQIPLTPSGKIDRRALAELQGADMGSDALYVAPRDETEAKLLSIWQVILGKEKIGIHENFFALGGHSLKVTRLGIEIYRQFQVKLPFKELFLNPVAERQAILIREAQKTPVTAIPRADVQPNYPLSSSQSRIWVLSQFEDGNVAYNVSGVYELTGALDIAVMEKAFTVLIDRHESLRTTFKEDDEGNICQYIQLPGQIGFRIELADLRDPAKPAQALKDFLHEHSFRPFDLQSGPLIRVCICQLSATEWVISYVMHHIISDGWSMGILIRELTTLYNGCINGEDPPLPALRVQYKDYAIWQAGQISSQAFTQHRNYWLRQLSGELPALDLPGDRRRPAVRTYNGSAVRISIDPALLHGVNTLCGNMNGTLFMGLMTALGALLYRYTGQTDIIIGTPVAGREHIDLQDQIGVFINMLAVRIQVDPENGFIDLFQHYKEVILQAYEHQAYPFDEIVEVLGVKRDLSRNALFDVMLVLENADAARIEGKGLDGATIRPYEGLTEVASKMDLTFTFRESADGLMLIVEYNSDIYDHDTITGIAGNFERLLAAVVQNPALPLGQLDFLGTNEKQQLLAGFNDTCSYYPGDTTVVHMFKEQARAFPEAIAIVAGTREVTYGELDGISDLFGAYLRQNKGLGSGDHAGIRLGRNEWMIIAMLGVWKAGAAYVPIDPAYPQERIDYIIADSRCKMVIDEEILKNYRSCQDQYEPSSEMVSRSSDLAYLIYTSGSTGLPKGVMIGHRSVYAFIHWCLKEFSSSSFDVVFGVTSICFDLSVYEIFFTLCSGKKLKILPDALAIPGELLSEKNILLNVVPGVVSALLSEKVVLDGVTVLNMAGETIPGSCIAGLDCKAMEVRNLYGPTEDTTYSTVYRIRGGDMIPIGKPISNTRVYILGPYGALQPVGVSGEIFLAGDGLALGYFNRPELTARKFTANPYRKGEKMYATGDIGRWMPDGNIMLAGRKDEQIKLRGYRIEPGEIEKALQEFPAIDAVKIVTAGKEKEDKYLVAYILSGEKLDIAVLRLALKKKLPAYMIPSRFVQLETWPLTPNGKIDSSRLIDPGDQEGMELSLYVPPTSEMELRMVSIWQELLGKEKIGIKDDFFELGGHSLKAARLISRVNREFAVRIEMIGLFKEPTIESICEQISFMVQQNRQRSNRNTLVEIEL